MRKCKLSECVKEINDRTTENNQYEVLTSSKNGIFSQEEYFDKQVASKDNTGYKIIKNGQFTYRSMSDSGTFTINRLEDKEIGIVSPAYPVFEATNIDAEFLKYYFKSELFSKAIINLSQGSTRTSLKFKDLINIEIYLPEIEEQRRIVKILKNNDQVIEKYDELIREKEQFIKSQFVEMFGNVNCEKVELKSIAEVKGRVGWKGYTKSDLRSFGPLVLGATHLTDDGLINLSEPVFLSREKYEESPEIMVEKNDVIFAQRGSLGKIGLAKDDIGEATINPCVLILRPNNINPNFFRFLLIMEYENGNLARLNSGSTIPMISQKTIGDYRIILPEMSLQNEFEKIVQLIDKQKFNYINKINELKEIINIFLGGKKI